MFLERKLGFSIVHVDLGKGLVGELGCQDGMEK